MRPETGVDPSLVLFAYAGVQPRASRIQARASRRGWRATTPWDTISCGRSRSSRENGPVPALTSALRPGARSRKLSLLRVSFLGARRFARGLPCGFSCHRSPSDPGCGRTTSRTDRRIISADRSPRTNPSQSRPGACARPRVQLSCVPAIQPRPAQLAIDVDAQLVAMREGAHEGVSGSLATHETPQRALQGLNDGTWGNETDGHVSDRGRSARLKLLVHLRVTKGDVSRRPSRRLSSSSERDRAQRFSWRRGCGSWCWLSSSPREPPEPGRAASESYARDQHQCHLDLVVRWCGSSSQRSLTTESRVHTKDRPTIGRSHVAG